jgi:phage host-nuclease inhibitor protein Gam
MKKRRLKSAAVAFAVPADRDQCAVMINKIGVVSRQLTVLNSQMNDEIAKITDQYTGQFTPLQEELKQLQQGVQIFCEAFRGELTDGGETKTGHFITGTVQWRQRPPSVAAKGVKAIIDHLKSLGLHRFIRTKEELNKEAMLNEPLAIAGVPGLSIKTGVEDFVIEPLEIEET